jgi:hypothetical protein
MKLKALPLRTGRGRNPKPKRASRTGPARIDQTERQAPFWTLLLPSYLNRR